MTRLSLRLSSAALLLVLPFVHAQPAPSAPASTTSLERLKSDLAALLSSGPRVAGSPSVAKAADYLAAQYRASGFSVRFETFEYGKFVDRGSELRVNGRAVSGFALDGSSGAEVTAPLAPVSGTGTPEEFARANVKGKVAVVLRGGLRFGQKAQNALEAGAVGLVIVNNAPGALRGSLAGEVKLPVLALSSAQGEALLSSSGTQVTLSVRAGRETVQGRNLIAALPGVTAPRLLVGGHLDSVEGAPGANDNASGSVTTLELARRMANTPQGKEAWFMAFDGEEDGLRGSRAFVEKNPEVVRGLKAMLNFDMVGVDVTPLGVGGTPALVERARALVPDLRPMNDGSSGSDHASFLSKGVPALFFFRGLDANYHQPGDTVADPALLEQTVQVGLKVAQSVLAPTG